jgi:hypothetical protein
MRRGTSGVSEATALLRTARAGWTDKTGRLSIEYSLRKYADGTHVVDHHAEPA